MILRAWAVSKAFGPKEVLKEVSLQINERDRIAIVGPNGVGKSTLIRLLLGELKPDIGEVTRRTERVCYLSQFPLYEPEETVAQAVSRCGQAANRISRRMRELEQLMVEPGDADVNEVANEYATLQEEFLNADAFDDENKVKDVLAKVGFSDAGMQRKVAELSGGEKTKVMIARVLMQAEDADLLVLDEPTSHLDMDTIEWLENYLLKFPGAIVLVSHDRYFLDRTVTQVMEIEDGRVRQFSGNYTDYAKKKVLEVERQKIAAEKYQIEKARLETIAEEQHQKEWFKSTHKTRMKMVERLEEVEEPDERPELKFNVEVKERSGKNVIVASDMAVSRGGKQILKGLDLELEVGDKLGVFGPNGSGKTTFIKMLLNEVQWSGDLWIAPGAVIGYFGQGHDLLDPELTPEEMMLETLGRDARAKARNMLARFYLRGHEVDRPIKTLSGGERARVALSILLAEKRNLLLLDEPTNYLDIQARQAVENALRDYPGSLIIVTHDRYLLDSVCNMVAEMKNGRLEVFKGTYSQYKGRRPEVKETVEEAGVYRVMSGFTDWTTKTKYKEGEKVAIAQSELEKFRWAFDAGKLKKMGGTELKKVRK
ncbi:MAG: putative branched-chain amino acid transport ATP-binding protein LivG [Methanomassiliicoccales archaeon PtaU1.Bin124]|nr:MAG: putative branched-chain amino acid transport ATP-binding protein LivG [Methanomassiliicoccales archaeon PtaU1.Bin124]